MRVAKLVQFLRTVDSLDLILHIFFSKLPPKIKSKSLLLTSKMELFLGWRSFHFGARRKSEFINLKICIVISNTDSIT